MKYKYNENFRETLRRMYEHSYSNKTTWFRSPPHPITIIPLFNIMNLFVRKGTPLLPVKYIFMRTTSHPLNICSRPTSHMTRIVNY